MISRIKNIVFGLKQWELILLIILLNFTNNYLFSVISNLFDISLNKGFNYHYTIKEKIVLFVIAAPLIETLLFQYAVIEILKSIKIKLIYCCFLSAFVFASFHLYNIFYFLYAFVGGLLFAFLYVRGKNQKNAILLPLVTHIIYNGIVFISKYYLA
ncbi:CPBP family intramembrane glutamic endopeptidase [Flavobacterium sharifuzzamanii]|uniref:CPBP family intramembrane glutamic endopeptidase n=1 Tax=Flavobacterium sharifuzzamanii TaxID=2211133 RepID=UPI000DAE5EFF|nr:CPBP family intramembrane glutamic endopeptidase [Flavobacterium sharifuzzamanii]KAF2082815.1 CPBP family intramembrane metalloprotease [Flavobacterium sharifuzzamanii]